QARPDESPDALLQHAPPAPLLTGPVNPGEKHAAATCARGPAAAVRGTLPLCVVIGVAVVRIHAAYVRLRRIVLVVLFLTVDCVDPILDRFELLAGGPFRIEPIASANAFRRLEGDGDFHRRTGAGWLRGAVQIVAVADECPRRAGLLLAARDHPEIRPLGGRLLVGRDYAVLVLEVDRRGAHELQRVAASVEREARRDHHRQPA